MNFARKVQKKSTIIFDKVLLRYRTPAPKGTKKKIQNCLVAYGAKEADRLKDTFRFNWKRKSFVWKLAYFRHIAIITRMANIWVIAHFHRRNWHSSSFSNWNESPYTYCRLLLVKECFCNSYPCWTFVYLVSLWLLLFLKRNCNACRSLIAKLNWRPWSDRAAAFSYKENVITIVFTIYRYTAVNSEETFRILHLGWRFWQDLIWLFYEFVVVFQSLALNPRYRSKRSLRIIC